MKSGARKTSETKPLLLSVTPTLIIPRTNASDDLRQLQTQEINNAQEMQAGLLEGSNNKKKTCLIS